MIFVDTNVFIYAVGREHPLKSEARGVFEQAVADPGRMLVTSAEVLQELLHVYWPVQRMRALHSALELVQRTIREVWSIEPEDVYTAIDMAASHSNLGARDLIHLACCQRRGIGEIRTFDRALKAAFD